ncbi:Rieske 2Fe-2S domain-containing protein [Streptomyces sp. NPDC056149]|uniref:Rieske 2Fe-2S domain-containing protein n=1 Tax=unclassified Streptomyces TaxID=2593676 RepID=UPI0023818B2E|nr:Rieske 2Fe-2S domain-containing protein [Streptomyces sp. WZ-12]
MPVVTFSTAGRGNCVVVAGVPYVYARTPDGGFVMPAQCPHRGGPLHLGRLAPNGKRLVCPWHGGGSSLTRLRRQVPAVRSGDRVTAVLTDPDGAAAREPRTEYRPLSADLSA